MFMLTHKSVHGHKNVEASLDAIILTRCTHMYEWQHIDESCNLINYKFIALPPSSVVKKREKEWDHEGRKETQLEIFHVRSDWKSVSSFVCARRCDGGGSAGSRKKIENLWLVVCIALHVKWIGFANARIILFVLERVWNKFSSWTQLKRLKFPTHELSFEIKIQCMRNKVKIYTKINFSFSLTRCGDVWDTTPTTTADVKRNFSELSWRESFKRNLKVM